MPKKPWDSQLAYLLVYPFRNTPLSPNIITTTSLLAGLGAAYCFFLSNSYASYYAGGLYMIAMLLDHCDGELARLSGKSSRFGHTYDNIVGGINYSILFIGIGAGLYQRYPTKNWIFCFAVLAGLSAIVIVILRFFMEEKGGKKATKQPTFAGLEIEDILYAVGPIAWMDGLLPFLIAGGIGTPIFMITVIREFCLHRKKNEKSNV